MTLLLAVKNRTLIVTYAQSLQMFSQATADPIARAKAIAMVDEAETRELVITAVDVGYLRQGRGLADELHEMEQTKTPGPRTII